MSGRSCEFAKSPVTSTFDVKPGPPPDSAVVTGPALRRSRHLGVHGNSALRLASPAWKYANIRLMSRNRSKSRGWCSERVKGLRRAHLVSASSTRSEKCMYTIQRAGIGLTFGMVQQTRIEAGSATDYRCVCTYGRCELQPAILVGVTLDAPTARPATARPGGPSKDAQSEDPYELNIE